MGQVTVRPATFDDLDGIMAVENAAFGSGISAQAAAKPEVMAYRIGVCNGPETGDPWFFVAVSAAGTILAYIILQPVSFSPEECVSWEAATDRGTLQHTFDSTGTNVYIVSLASNAGAADHETVSKAVLSVVLEALKAWKRSGKRLLMFCSRIPSYADALSREPSLTIEEYWQRKRKDGGPRDGMCHEYYVMGGLGEWPGRCRLLKDGWPVDNASHGHGVLFVVSSADNAIGATSDVLKCMNGE